jgi:hypothetical protein
MPSNRPRPNPEVLGDVALGQVCPIREVDDGPLPDAQSLNGFADFRIRLWSRYLAIPIRSQPLAPTTPGLTSFVVARLVGHSLIQIGFRPGDLVWFPVKQSQHRRRDDVVGVIGTHQHRSEPHKFLTVASIAVDEARARL